MAAPLTTHDKHGSAGDEGFTLPTHVSRSWWGQSPLGVDRYTAALERTAHAFEHYDNVVVSFSGGKDSTAVLMLALEVAAARGETRPLPVYFLDEEGITYQTEDYVRRVIADHGDAIDLHWFAVPVTHRNACSADTPWWYPWAPEARERWVRPLPPEAIDLDAFSARYGYTDPGPHDPAAPPGSPTRPTWPVLAAFLADRLPGRTAYLMGIRASESVTRHRAIASKRLDNYVIPSSTAKADKVYPIYDWTTTDVWTAPRLRGWDHNTSYDLMEMAGIPPDQQRCAPPFGDEPSRGLWMWAACFPDIWDLLCYRVPGAATAARYARTALYASGSLPAKPPGTPWPAFIKEVLTASHADENTRAVVAGKVNGLIKHHYRRTTDPILTVPHPVSGLHWGFVLKVAARGDLKNRMVVGRKIAQSPEILATYREHLARYRAGDLDA